MTNVLVTGGAGYIGSHACKTLSRAGLTPIVFDNMVYGHESAVKWGPLEKGSILDKARLESVFAQYQPVGVLHFAAYAYVGESVVDPGKYYKNNVAGTLSLLECMHKCEINNLIFSSSCATYGVPQSIPINESFAQLPINPYGASKLMAERMIKDFHTAHGLNYSILRYFNAAGADPDGELGEEHQPETHLIPLVVDAALGFRDSVTIFGQDYPTADGSCIRDYIHVTDLAEAHYVALASLLNNGASGEFNLGVGKGYSVLEVIKAVEEQSNAKVPIKNGSRRPGDPPELVADVTKFSDAFSWHPVWSDLETIVKTALMWRKNHGLTHTSAEAGM